MARPGHPGGTAGSIYLSPFRVDVSVRPGVGLPVSRASLARVMVAALAAGGAPRPASIGLILSDDAELAELNAAHMGISGPTDVLSFPLLPPEAYPPHQGRERGVAGARRRGLDGFALPPGARVHLGDVIVSVERALDQARDGRGGQTSDLRWSPADELSHTEPPSSACGVPAIRPAEGWQAEHPSAAAFAGLPFTASGLSWFR